MNKHPDQPGKEALEFKIGQIHDGTVPANGVYNPYNFTWFSWEEPVIEKKKAKTVKMVPVSAFERPPVFDGYCLTQEDQFACSNTKLQQYISQQLGDYPDAALRNNQEGLEYVTFPQPGGEV